MAIEIHENGGFTVTDEHVDVAAFLTLIKMLDLEIRTGMKMSRGMSLTKIAQQRYGATSRTKQGCRDYLANIYKEATGRTV